MLICAKGLEQGLTCTALYDDDDVDSGEGPLRPIRMCVISLKTSGSLRHPILLISYYYRQSQNLEHGGGMFVS